MIFLSNFLALACGGILNVTEIPSYIQSPGYPFNYPKNRECMWTIKAPTNMTVAAMFVTFHLEDSVQCSYDSLTLYDKSPSGRRIASLCGTMKSNLTYYGADSTMVVIFKSDGSKEYNGVKAKFVKANFSGKTVANLAFILIISHVVGSGKKHMPI